MTQRMALSLLLFLVLNACSGAGGSLPAANKSSVVGLQSTTYASERASISQSDSPTPYTYTAPWGGFGSLGYIYVLKQGPCNDIPITQSPGYKWPSFLNTLATGTEISISGVPSYPSSWAKASNCPTGGIVASGISIGSGPTPSAPPVSSSAISIHSGGPPVGKFVADTDYYGGIVAGTADPINMSNVAGPAPQSVYQTNRYGPHFSYIIPNVSPSVPYIVRLHFAETYFDAPGQRLFGVAINGSQILTGFDIFRSSGGKDIAIVKQYNVLSDTSGKISIDFTATVNNAQVSGIEILAVSGSPTPIPVSSPTAQPTGVTVNYPAPLPQWKHALALTTQINPTKAAGNIKTYDAAARQFYMNWNPTFSMVSGGARGWNSPDEFINTSGSGDGHYFASFSDPTYALTCVGPAYCGYTNGITGIHIPNGARTQNSGASNCDCHLYVVEPVGWVPGSGNSGVSWPNIAPSQYEIDLENVANLSSAVGQSSRSVTTFIGGGNVYASGGAAFSTGSSGWYGGFTSSNNGFSPMNNAPSSGWGGSAVHGNSPYTATTVTAQDMLQGAINHEMFLATVCAENAEADSWPSAVRNTDFSCSSLGGRGWSYGDHIWLNMSDQAIEAAPLTSIQKIFAKGLAHYGAVILDVQTAWGPTFQVNTTGGDAAWNDVSKKYNLPAMNFGGSSGFALDMGLPFSIMNNAHAINSCVVREAC